MVVIGCITVAAVIYLFPAIAHLPFADKLKNAFRAAVHHILPAQHHRGHKTIFLGHEALLDVERLLIPSHNFGPNLKSLSEGQ